MSESKYPNSASLFQNDRKTKDTHPDYTGQGEFFGKEVWLSGWKKQSKSGKTFLSISIKEKDAAMGGGKESRVNVPMDDDVPF